MSPRLLGLTADIAAHGLIEACRIYGVDPLRLGQPRVRGAKMARSCVAQALHGAMNPAHGSRVALGRIFDCSPHPADARGVTLDHKLQVFEAMRLAGLDASNLRLTGKISRNIGRDAAKPPRPVEPSTPALPPAGIEVSPEIAAAKARIDALAADIDARAAERRAKRQAKLRPPVRGLTILPGRVQRSERAARRQMDQVDDRGSPPLTLGDGDERLVRACLAHGGFPTAGVLNGKTVWIGPDGGEWRYRA